MSTPIVVLLLVAAAVIVLFTFVLIAAYVRARRVSQLPARPSFRCPSCKSEQIDLLRSGLWDGEDFAGSGSCGIFEFGICKECGSRCARFEDNQPFIPTDEQWQGPLGPLAWHQKDAEKLSP